MTAAEAFSEDLYRLLGVVSIAVPPLRERREEIRLPGRPLPRRFAGEFNRPQPKLSSEILEMLSAYDWQGNARELESLVKRWVVLGDRRTREGGAPVTAAGATG